MTMVDEFIVLIHEIPEDTLSILHDRKKNYTFGNIKQREHIHEM